jgi:hypothetical protein
MAKQHNRKSADDLLSPAGMVVTPDEENTPDEPKGEQPRGEQHGDSGGINLITPEGPRRSDAGGQSTGDVIRDPETGEQPMRDAEEERAWRDAPPADATPADLYADAVARHGKDSHEAAKLRMQHAADAGFQAVADWIDRAPVGIVRAGTQKPEQASRGGRRFRVKHQDVPAYEVMADSPQDAVDRYKKWAGILRTPHNFDVEEL